MKKINFLLLAASIFVGYKNLSEPMSNGAPAASTGAPDERHCSTSGCHSDYAPNTGTAQLLVSVGSGISQYEFGKTYPVTVTITDPGVVRFGFQMVALNANNTNSGDIRITDETRTQAVTGYGTLSDRKYATYTYDGSNAISVGKGEWSFEWTAPASNEGNITLYVAAVSANNDETDAGDYSYLKKVVLSAPQIFWNTIPNVSASAFMIQSSGAPLSSLNIYNIEGEKVYERHNIDPGILSIEINCSSGVYFISAVQNGKTSVQKIIISR